MSQPGSAYPDGKPQQKLERHTMSVLVDNEPGVLARVIGLFSGRGYNIESLTVSETEHEAHLSRITIVTSGTPMVIEQIQHQLERLVPIHSVTNLTVKGSPIEHELAMVKVASLGDKRVEALRLSEALGAEIIELLDGAFRVRDHWRANEDRAIHRADAAARPGRGLPHGHRLDLPRVRPDLAGLQRTVLGGTNAASLGVIIQGRGVLMRVYYDRDADLNLIKGKKVAIIGYGSQGHAHALNLKESGIKNVAVGLSVPARNPPPRPRRPGSRSWTCPRPPNGPTWSCCSHPDELQAGIWEHDLKPNMKEGAALFFAHGLNIHFNLIEPRPDMDVCMVAPKGPGHTVRAEYSRGAGVPCLMAIAQDATGNAHDLTLSYAAAIGGGRAGIIGTTFREECETDLFGEQSVLCGGLVELMRNGYETLVEAGYAPEMAYFECVHEVKLIVDLIYEGGIANMNYSVSNTAEYGEYVSGPRVVGPESKAAMKQVLADIQSGKFVKDWMLENRVNQTSFKAMRAKCDTHDMEVVGKRLREMMPWIAERKMVDKSKN